MASFVSDISSRFPLPGFFSGGILARESLIHHLPIPSFLGFDSLDTKEDDSNLQVGLKTLVNAVIRVSSVTLSPYNMVSLPYVSIVTNPLMAIGKTFQAYDLYTEGKRGEDFEETDLARIDEAKKKIKQVAGHVALFVVDYCALGLGSAIFNAVSIAHAIAGAAMDMSRSSKKIHDQLFEQPGFVSDDDDSVEDSSSEYWSSYSSSGSESDRDSSSEVSGGRGRGRGGFSASSARGGRGRGRGGASVVRGARGRGRGGPLEFHLPLSTSHLSSDSESESGGVFVGGDDSDDDALKGYSSSGESHSFSREAFADSSELSSENDASDFALPPLPPPRRRATIASSSSASSPVVAGRGVRKKRLPQRYSGSSPSQIGSREREFVEQTARDLRFFPTRASRSLRPNPRPSTPWTPTHNP